jgi:hypothetical protein
MQIIQTLEIAAVIACVILAVMIFKWFLSRYKICGKTDLLCYVNGERTTATNLIQGIF